VPASPPPGPRPRCGKLAKHYNLDNVANRILEIYLEILKNPPRYNRNILTFERIRKEENKLSIFL
jgi:hypothetical protein